ncbi:SSrecog-domain-containing protein [Fistulina hepatica ATCC 64428]|uniref:FACT complex subunit POB3 n=1 Tax=Fistulina hepatica ATCC 64428 TaxID=1128425 RepID=A0A0D7A6T9_9AGAR|nr:SSrecog-domain-containing protein [Fistulina hepatica ATCC 64428]
MATQQFDHIYHGLSPGVGKLRIAASGIAWKSSDSAVPITTIPSEHIKWAQWIRVARNFQLRIGLKDHRRETFDGFPRTEHDRLYNFFKSHFSVTLETIETSLKGWNWGVTDFQGAQLAFMVQEKTAFELPLHNVANSNIAGRTEVSLEFGSKSDSKIAGEELVELRFYVPGVHTKVQSASDAGSDAEQEEEEEVSAAQVFHDMVKEKAELGQVTGDLILSFEEVLIITPRGRYDLDMFPEFLRLRGKTYDYKILYSSIARLFLLPKDDQHVLFILGLNTPIRQGQTRYSFLVMQFTRDEEISAELNLSEQELEKYERLDKNYEGPTFEVMSSVFRGLTGKKIIGTGSFSSRDGHACIKANLKATLGDLFLLEKYIFFVSKSPTLIEISDVHQIVFSRVGASAAARTFDLNIVTRSGPEYTFTSIAKDEHDGVETFLKEKKVRVKSEMVPDADILMAEAGVDDSDEDEDMRSVDSDGPPRKVAMNDEDSDEDEDFQASSSDEGSPTEGESSDEGAATASDASGDKDVAKAGKSKKAKGKAKEGGSAAADGAKKKKKKTSAAAADKADESDAGDGEKKPRPKPKLKKKKPSDDSMDEDATKPKAKKAKKAEGDDGMDVDVEGEAPALPRPKPTPKVKPGEEDEPPKKKVKTSVD